MMKRKLLLFTMLCCMALSASACGTDGTHQQTTENEITGGSDENANDTVVSGEGLFDLTTGENGKPPVITLSSGYTMPVLGLGTYSLHGDECINAILSAIKLGYRKFDTATFYGNEEEVGEAIRRSGVPREEFFICTKLYPNEFGHAEEAIEASLAKLDIGYVDLMLLHHPGRNDVEAYKAMERAVAAGKIRSLGVSNYYIKEMTEFLPKVSIKPVMTQNEIHPYYQEKEVREYMHRNGIVIEGWYPFGGRGWTQAMFSNETIKEIAEAHGKSPAQVILRWDLQHGVAVIPGSSNPDHQKENISVFDFELTPEEMARIDALDRNEKHDWY
jgi:diketogulonate reductase-like aldo/keto reductase